MSAIRDLRATHQHDTTPLTMGGIRCTAYDVLEAGKHDRKAAPCRLR